MCAITTRAPRGTARSRAQSSADCARRLKSLATRIVAKDSGTPSVQRFGCRSLANDEHGASCVIDDLCRRRAEQSVQAHEPMQPVDWHVFTPSDRPTAE